MKIGFHVSSANGLKETAQTILNEKLSAVQFFSGNPKKYFPDKHNADDLEAIRKINIPKFIHSNYYINLADNKPVLVKSIADNLRFCDSIDATGLIIHMGSHDNLEQGLKNTYHNIKMAYLWSKAKTKVIIEGTAEGGKRLTLDNAVFFIENSKNLNLGLCVDTAHVYAAGYNVIETIEKYHKYITVIHLNNPNPEVLPGKHLDRHNISLFNETARFTKTEIENIMILADLYNIPMILETGEPSSDLVLCESIFIK